MQIFKTIEQTRAFVKQHRDQAKKIGLVPTMGYLHEGHLSLVKQAKETCDIVVMSIFVNPIQFGPHEDLAKYPRDLQRDARLAETAGVDAIFAPTVKEMYPAPIKTYVNVEMLTENLCGASRPGHFQGVTTVVSKLFHIVQPDKAFFGQKDAQQLRVIQQMAADLNLPVEIVGCPIVREADGLALSSRNLYLSYEERQQARSLNQSLQLAEQLFAQGERSAKVLIDTVTARIRKESLADIEYVKLVDLQTLTDIEHIQRDALLALAVRFGTTRLIDNTIFRVAAT